MSHAKALRQERRVIDVCTPTNHNNLAVLKNTLSSLRVPFELLRCSNSLTALTRKQTPCCFPSPDAVILLPWPGLVRCLSASLYVIYVADAYSLGLIINNSTCFALMSHFGCSGHCLYKAPPPPRLVSLTSIPPICRAFFSQILCTLFPLSCLLHLNCYSSL